MKKLIKTLTLITLVILVTACGAGASNTPVNYTPTTDYYFEPESIQLKVGEKAIVKLVLINADLSSPVELEASNPQIIKFTPFCFDSQCEIEIKGIESGTVTIFPNLKDSGKNLIVTVK